MAGTLLASLFRTEFRKFTMEMQKHIEKELKSNRHDLNL